MLPQVLSTALLCTHASVELSQSSGVAVWMGKDVWMCWCCLWKMLPSKAKCLCPPSFPHNQQFWGFICTYIPWRESLVSCTVDFLREGITLCLEQTLGGIQSSLQECGSEPKAAGAADPRKAQGLQGVQWAMEGGRKDFWPESKARQLEIYSTALSALISQTWSSHGGVRRAWLVKHKPHV